MWGTPQRRWGRGLIVETRLGEGVEANINTDYVYIHTTKQVTGTGNHVYVHCSSLLLNLR